MTDTFTKDARRKLSSLVKERECVRRKLEELDTQISSLQVFVSAKAILSGETTISEAATLITGYPPKVEIRAPKAPIFRGRKITAVLQILRDEPDGLTLDGIIQKARSQQIDLDRSSLRSQLARVAKAGRIEKRGSFYIDTPPKGNASPPKAGEAS